METMCSVDRKGAAENMRDAASHCARSGHRCGRIEGELWSACTDDVVEVGDTVTIVAVEGTTLKVIPKSDAAKVAQTK
jgi:membrane protein implicated in regulation of membrane protease activity